MLTPPRGFLVGLLLLSISAGCGKKAGPASEPAPVEATPDPVVAVKASHPSDKDKLIGVLKTKRGETQRKAIDDLAILSETDPTIGDALVELLRDRTTNGAGKTHLSQITSVREAAALALMHSGPKGDALLKDRGLLILREGLSDKDPAIREHTAQTLRLLGPIAKSLASPLQRLCADIDPLVREAAYRALAEVGVADPAGLARLLSDKNPDIRKHAAEAVSARADIPADALPALVRALDDEEETIRLVAATAIAGIDRKATNAVVSEKLAIAIRKSYPPTYDPNDPLAATSSQFIYWRALVGQGKWAVDAAIELLKHTNPIVRTLAVQTLGELGSEAKPAVEALRKSLTDDFANVALESACVLCRLGENPDDAIALVKAALASTSQGVASAAIQAVPRMGKPGKELAPIVLEKLNSKQLDARFAAIGFIATLEPMEAAKQITMLARLLEDGEPEIRIESASVLQSLGSVASPVAEALGKAIATEKEDSVRDQFLETVASIGPKAKPALPGLLRSIADNTAPIDYRIRAIAAAVAIDPAANEITATLLPFVGDGESRIRSVVALSLGRLDPLPTDATTAMVKLARTDRETSVRLAAVQGLVLAGSRAKAAKVDLEAIAKDGLPGVDLWAKVALAAIDGDVRKSAATIRAGLLDKSPNVRTASAEALLLIGPEISDLPVLLKLLRETGSTARIGAANAIGRIGPSAKEALPVLIQLLKDSDAVARTAAAEALGKIGPVAIPAAPRLREMVVRDPLVSSTARKALEAMGVKLDAPRRAGL